MFDTINNPPKNEQDVELARIHLKEMELQLQLNESNKEVLREITKQLPIYDGLCEARKLIPPDGNVTFNISGTVVTISRHFNVF